MPTFAERASRARITLQSVQKPGGGVPAYMRWLNRPAARVVVSLAYGLRLSPNTLTAISLGLSILGVVLVLAAPMGWRVGLGAALLFALAFVFDSADGQLARLVQASSPAGEWLDHVVDAFRAPAMHVAVAVAVWVKVDNGPVAAAALAMAVIASGQAMSQMLAEQLIRGAGSSPRRGGIRQSWILLPTDPGVWAWSFILWGAPRVFGVVYGVLVVLNMAHTVVSLLRRYRDLRALSSGS